MKEYMAVTTVKELRSSQFLILRPSLTKIKELRNLRWPDWNQKLILDRHSLFIS